MRKSFLIVFNSTFATGVQVTNFLDKIDPNGDWHRPFDHCVFFTSNLSAGDLAKKFETQFGLGSGKLFMVTEIGASKQGRLTDRGWRVLNNPYNTRGQ